MKKILIGCAVLVVVVGAGAFYGGMVYGKGSNKGLSGVNFNGQQFTANMGQRAGRINGGSGTGGAGGGFVSGEVISQDNQSITIKLRDAGSKIIFFGTSTQVMKTAEGSLSDIKVGENLVVTGSLNSDGSITAQSIQLRPASPIPPTTQ